jgi:hypothetical protein
MNIMNNTTKQWITFVGMLGGILVLFIAIFMPVVSGTTLVPSSNKTTIMIVNDIVQGKIQIPLLLR